MPGLDEALLVDRSARPQIVAAAAVAEGRLYVQGLSSMLAARLLDPQPGEEVLDLAAAPGGKTLHIAALMRNEGRIAAVEPIRGRYYKLQANLRRGGATIVRTYRADGRSVGRRAPERFDRVLLDAPCSGEARFHRRRPSSWATWSPRKIRECARKQRGLLRSALAALKPGGTLLYCTCAFAPEENELVVDDCVCRAGEGIEIAPIELGVAAAVQPGWTRWEDHPMHPDLALAVRILPDERFDGFFFCKLVKRAGRRSRSALRARPARSGRRRPARRRRRRPRGESLGEPLEP